MRYSSVLVALATVFSIAVDAIPTAHYSPNPRVQSLESLKPRQLHSRSLPEIIEDSYIIVFKDDVDDAAIEAHESAISNAILKRHGDGGHGGKRTHGMKHKYKLKGFHAYHVNADAATIAQISSSPEVLYIEKNAAVHVAGKLSQKSSTFGLSRISHRSKGASNYVFDPSACTGTTAYVIDTGILLTHEQFQGRAVFGTNIINDVDTDENGHGTHVSGTIGGKDFGVCKDITLVSVKVLDATGSGTYAGVIAGIQWAVADAQSKGITAKSVINLSIAGPVSIAVNKAAAGAVSAGITVVVAAGNENTIASNDSPASEPTVITVGAIDVNDARGVDSDTVGSNFGPAVDVFAPGWGVVSAYIGDGNVGTQVLDGTSQASPHVAGLAAYFIALEGLKTPSEVVQCIKTRATTGDVTNPGDGSPNLIIYNASGY